MEKHKEKQLQKLAIQAGLLFEEMESLYSSSLLELTDDHMERFAAAVRAQRESYHELLSLSIKLLKPLNT
jgi:hypothetical protein